MALDGREARLALAGLPAGLRDVLVETVAAPGFQGVIPAGQAEALMASAGLIVEELMVRLVPVAQLYAAVPISGFRVGAVAQALPAHGRSTGALFLGANLEFEGTDLGTAVHAEQSALSNAWVNGEKGLASLAVSGSPCGHCRQFLCELTTADHLRIVSIDGAVAALSDLLPRAFGPQDLGREGGLMRPEHHGLRLAEPWSGGRAQGPGRTLVDLALDAANASYAPYSLGHAGVALQTASGALICGRYAENAAFNPSLPPMAAALALWRLRDGGQDPVVRAHLVERPSMVRHARTARAALRSATRADLAVSRASDGPQT